MGRGLLLSAVDVTLALHVEVGLWPSLYSLSVLYRAVINLSRTVLPFLSRQLKDPRIPYVL